MSEESNPYMKMTEEELIESCATDDGAKRAIKLVEDWLNTRNSLSSVSKNKKKKRRRRAYIERGREEGHNRLFNDYFSDNPVYNDDQFRRKFRMRRHVFLRIVEALGNHSEYFRTRNNACGRNGFSSLQKCTVAIRMLAYGVVTDCGDEYVPIGESTAVECVKKFVRALSEVFGAEYLRKPNDDDTRRLMEFGEKRGFPGMMGSIDSMHWEWKNCSDKWIFFYRKGDKTNPTIMLEMVVSEDLWIWHAFLGCPKSNNNLDVFGCTPSLDEVYEGRAPQVNYAVNGSEYHTGYYLTDGIYPDWPTFIKPIQEPQQPKEELFAEHHEEARKDVERAFKVLQARFTIIRGPGRVWDRDALRDIICACIILHNMIVEDERGTCSKEYEEDAYDNSSNDVPMPAVNHAPLRDYETYIQTTIQVHDEVQHHKLQADLMENLWQHFGKDS